LLSYAAYVTADGASELPANRQRQPAAWVCHIEERMDKVNLQVDNLDMAAVGSAVEVTPRVSQEALAYR